MEEQLNQKCYLLGLINIGIYSGSSLEGDGNILAVSLLAHQFQLSLLCLAHPLLSYISQ